MALLKKGVLCPVYNGLQSSAYARPRSHNTSPHTLPTPRARPATQERPCTKSRTYATTRRGTGPEFRDNMNWPCWNANPKIPSPYDIFDIDRTAVYSKRRYYELVKMYHPDRSALEHTCKDLSAIEKLERYRLVVQAHEILSDPVKRRAYDVYGAGWGAKPVVKEDYMRSTNPQGKAYGTGPEHDSSPFANATWEDWERWYRRQDDINIKQSYAGTYTNPNMFASFVILMAVLAGVLQATRAGQSIGGIEEKARAFTEETRHFLTTRAQNYEENDINGARDRVRHFLEKRDPSRYGLKEEEEDAYRQHFGDKHIAPDQSLTSSRQSVDTFENDEG